MSSLYQENARPQRVRKKRAGKRLKRSDALIGQGADMSLSDGYTFDQMSGNPCSSLFTGNAYLTMAIVLVIIALAAVLICVIVVVITRPGRGSITTTAATLTGTTTSAGTTTTAGGTTTSGGSMTEAPSTTNIVVTCPSNVTVLLGKPYDTSATGTATALGGCSALTITHEDDVVTPMLEARHAPTHGGRDAAAIMTPPQQSCVHVVLVQGHATLNQHQHKRKHIRKRSVGIRAPNYPTTQLSVDQSTLIMDSGVRTPSPAMDVSDAHVVTLSNGASGSVMRVYDKSSLISAPLVTTALSSLPEEGSVCLNAGTGYGDMLYDVNATRWIFVERANGTNTVCFYVSNSSNMATATLYLYELTFAFVPNTIQLGLMNDYYTLSFASNTSPLRMALIERRPLVTGSLTTRVMSITSPQSNLAGFPQSDQSYTPVTVAGSPHLPNITTLPGVMFMRVRDDELHNPGDDPDASNDALDIVHCTSIDFSAPSAMCEAYSINVAEFSSATGTCASYDACIETPGSVRLDPVRTRLMPRLVFRRIPECNNVQRVYGSFTINANGTLPTSVQWFELDYDVDLGQMTLYQQGVVKSTSDGLWRWLPSMAPDRYGNVLMIYSGSNSSVSPSLYASSRMQDDTLNGMRNELQWATGSTWVDPVTYDASRWGDRFTVANDANVVNQFYVVGQYTGPSATWLLRLSQMTLTGNTIHRTWTAQDTCDLNATCVQEIVIGDGGGTT